MGGWRRRLYFISENKILLFFGNIMIRLWIATLQLLELFVSSLVHLLYGFYIFSKAVAGDLSQTLNEMFFKPNMNIQVTTDISKETTTNVDNLPPIVLVHGIFGFGKGVSFSFFFFSWNVPVWTSSSVVQFVRLISLIYYRY